MAFLYFAFNFYLIIYYAFYFHRPLLYHYTYLTENGEVSTTFGIATGMNDFVSGVLQVGNQGGLDIYTELQTNLNYLDRLNFI